MTTTENPLLTKWTTGQGLSGSSLLSSSLLTYKSESLATSMVDRKRKTGTLKLAEVVEKKKAVERRPDLSSSLLTKYDSGSFLDPTPVSMTTRSHGTLQPSKSHVTTGSGLTSQGLRPSVLSSTTLGESSSLRSSLLTSSLLKTSTDSSLLSAKRTRSELSTPQSSISSGQSKLSSFTTGQSQLSSSLLSTRSQNQIGGGVSSLLGSFTLLSKATPTSGLGISAVPLSSVTSGLKSDLLRITSVASSKEEMKTKKTGKKKSERKGNKRVKLEKHVAPPPTYDLTNEIEGGKEIEMPRFVPPDRDRSLITAAKLHDVNGLKFALVNAVSGSLICQPDFRNSQDLTRVTLVTMADRVICYDPEFVLKVALYTRKQLNIRTTANFLLALASHMPACRPYLKKYFSSSIALPSDWIEVAEIYSAFPEKTLPLGSLPSALRRAMVAKFPDFDKYQLAKYNKESSKKKKKKKQKVAEDSSKEEATTGRGRGRGGRGRGGRGAGRGGAGSGKERDHLRDGLNLFDSDSSSSGSEEDSDEEREKGLDTVMFDDGESPAEIKKMSFTLKQLIRKLHITEPVEHVMCLIGKKYPMSLDEFYRSRLPGTFEEERAGKRMKLPVPETWETQVSLKGNKAEVWQELIDHKKLPFMAMLRNLRNLIKAGISGKHHNNILRRLTDEKSVINSKQFPFRFFSAYEVLNQLQADFEISQAAIVQEAVNAEGQASESSRGGATTRGRGRGRGRGAGTKEKLTAENWWKIKRQRKKEKNKGTKETPFDTNLINRYRKALDTAVKLATVYNVQPIRGRTIILCDIGANMQVPCTAAKGLGKPRTMQEVSVLLGLMCKYSCEDCNMVVFDSQNSMFGCVELASGTILENMAVVLGEDTTKNLVYGQFEAGLPMSILYDNLRDRIQIDNLLVLTGGGDLNSQRASLNAYLDLYRRIVNPNLLYVNVSFAGRNCGFATDIKPEHDNNIYISGFSDQILRFIAERGEGGQLKHIENIDEAFQLKPLPPVLGDKPAPPKPALEKPLPVAAQTPSWRTARVFISSTFRDMHGERDLLTRYVFPELRALGKKHFVNVYEVDLRWGVTEEETKKSKTLELCLSEVSRCQLFVGILGSRYGWVPDKYDVPDTPEFEWVKGYPLGASVTELEIQCAALGKQKTDRRDNAFFFFRDPSFESDIPKQYKEDFESESPKSQMKMVELKNRIRTSGLEVFDNYPCHWGGVVDGKPIVSGLELFGTRSLNNLWNGIQKMFPDDDAMLDETSHTNKLHDAFVERLRKVFVGRNKLRKECVKMLTEMKSGVVALVGKPGTGKSALLASLISDYQQASNCESGLTLLTHCVGAAPGSTNILATLKRLCHELNARFSLNMEVPEDFKNLVAKFSEMLQESATYCGSPLILFMDGLDNMEPAYLPHTLDWIPEVLPKNVIFVLTCLSKGKFHEAVQRRKATEATVEGLELMDKAEVVRSHLATHRKTLDESPFNNQMKLLVSKKEANVPLYLTLACEELRVHGVFEKVTLKLKSLPQTVPTLLQEVMLRMESDLGKDVMETALTLLVCARNGLEHTELHDLLSLHNILGGERPKVKDIVNMKPLPEECLPSAVYAQLQRALQSFLNDPLDSWSSRLSLSHVDIIQAVRQRYLKMSAAMETELYLHRLLAGYFYSQADPARDGSWKGKSAHAFTELPYHLLKSCSFSELEDVVCSLQFIYSKCMLGLAAELLEDYQPIEMSNKTQERDQLKFFERVTVKDYKSFVSRSLHILSSYPALTWQQAYNENTSSKPAQDVQTVLQCNSLPSSEKSLVEWNSKPVNVDPCYLTISNLPEPMTCVAVSQDNRHFACGGDDCLVHLYDLNTGKEIRSFRGHADSITDVCFVGSQKLCSVSMDSSVSVWDVNEGHRLFSLQGHNRRVNSCASDKAGTVLATASWDCMIKIWDMKKGFMICEFKVGSPVNCVSFHPEGQKIVSGQWDSTIKIWDIFHKTKIAVLRGHQTSVRDVDYSPSGCYIASAALDGDVKLWAADTGSQVGNVQGHALPINKLTFSPTGKELITVSDDHKIKVWSGHLGKPIITIGKEELGPAVAIAISPQRDTVAIGYHSGMIVIHDILSGAELSSRQVHFASVRCLKYMTAAYLISGSDDCTAKILKENLKEACVLNYHQKPVMSVDICRDYLAVTSEDCTCSVYENPLKYGAKTISNTPTKVCVLGTHTGPVTSCSFNKTGNQIATGSRDMSVRIWDLIQCTFDAESPTPLHVIHNAHNDWVTDLKWSNTADFLITSSNDFTLKVWDVSKIGTTPGETQKDSTAPNICKVKFTMTGHMGSVNHLGYSYGCVVSTCSDGAVKMWSHRGVEITTLYGHMQRSNGCDISVKLVDEELDDVEELDWTMEEERPAKVLQPKLENVMVATCGDDGTARLWYPLQANELACLTGHSDRVLSVAANSHGNLCTTSLDKSIKLWSCDPESKSVIGGHDSPVTFVSCNNHRSVPTVLTGSRDGTVKVWVLDGTRYDAVISLKAHKKAVTCGSWLDRTTFVTGSDDEYISVWKLNEVSGNIISARKVNAMKSESPILSMDTNGDATDPFIFSTEWSGAIKIWEWKGLLGTLQLHYNRTCWLLKIRYVGNNTLLLTTMDGTIEEIKLNKGKTKMNDMFEVASRSTWRVPQSINSQNSLQTDLPDHKKVENWIFDAIKPSQGIISGDSRGQLSFVTPKEVAVKVHAAEITCVLYDQGFTFTGSKDKTIKVWNNDMQQVGQFFCISPVTSMVLLGKSTPKEIPIVFGDELGFVNFITWKTGY